jgi:hypothetical protein
MIPDLPVCGREAVAAGGEKDRWLLGRRVWCHLAPSASDHRLVDDYLEVGAGALTNVRCHDDGTVPSQPGAQRHASCDALCNQSSRME